MAIGAVAQGLENGLAANAIAPNFTASASDGKTYTLKSLTGNGPAFFYFLKDSCSANPYAVKYFNRLYNAYKGKVAFYALTDYNKSGYAGFVKEYQAPYVGILDPQRSVIHSYNVHHSQTVMLVGQDGKVVKTFKGFGKTALAELNASLAQVAKTDIQKVDFSGAPSGVAYG